MAPAPSSSSSASLAKARSHPPPAGPSGYQLVHQNETLDGDVEPAVLPPSLPTAAERRQRTLNLILAVLVVVSLASNVYLSLPYIMSSRPGSSSPGSIDNVPQYFQTYPELWPGPTATGPAPFMAQTRTFDPLQTYVPNEPLQTAIPIEGMRAGNQSIFQMMGFLSPYFPSPGFGVDEYPLPEGAELVQVQMVSRHGARYPTSNSGVEKFGKKIGDASGKFKANGALAFLNNWTYQLGNNILVNRGREELFNSGILHNYMYGRLYNPNSKLIVRTTTQDRMLKSAENWMAGFFGLEWTNNATIEVIIEDNGFNNSLAGSLNCPNAYKMSSGDEARNTWIHKYLQDGTARCIETNMIC
jgi:hypothetical protein